MHRPDADFTSAEILICGFGWGLDLQIPAYASAWCGLYIRRNLDLRLWVGVRFADSCVRIGLMRTLHPQKSWFTALVRGESCRFLRTHRPDADFTSAENLICGSGQRLELQIPAYASAWCGLCVRNNPDLQLWPEVCCGLFYGRICSSQYLHPQKMSFLKTVHSSGGHTIFKS